MSGLVSYDSSSDDEKGQIPDDVKSHEKHTVLAGQPQSNGVSPLPSDAVDSEHAKVDDNETSPIIGPKIPDSYESYPDHSPSTFDESTMPERDKVRYLTQTKYPMTSMPPSPPGSPNPETQARFRRFLDLKKRGIHFNQDLANKQSFQNPNFLSNMMTNVGIQEAQYNSSLPSTLWDPASFPSLAYKEELLSSQQSIRDHEAVTRRQQSAAGKRKIEFMAGTGSSNSSRQSTPGLQQKRKGA